MTEASEGLFDFLRGGKPISIGTFPLKSNAEIKPSNDPINQINPEKWILYTLNPESKSCPLDCIIIHVILYFQSPS